MPLPARKSVFLCMKSPPSVTLTRLSCASKDQPHVHGLPADALRDSEQRRLAPLKPEFNAQSPTFWNLFIAAPCLFPLKKPSESQKLVRDLGSWGILCWQWKHC